MPDPILFYLDEHVPKAVREGRTLVTRDADYLRLHAAGQAHASIVYYRLPMSIGAIIRGLERISQLRSANAMRNRVGYL